jgi:hypothetical protein
MAAYVKFYIMTLCLSSFTWLASLSSRPPELYQCSDVDTHLHIHSIIFLRLLSAQQHTSKAIQHKYNEQMRAIASNSINGPLQLLHSLSNQ